jgi:hypothetical protein
VSFIKNKNRSLICFSLQEAASQQFFGPALTGTKPKVKAVPDKPLDKVRGKYFRRNPEVSLKRENFKI